MRYRNKLNGRIIDISSELSGDAWEPVTASAPDPAETGKKAATAKKPAAKAPAKAAPKKKAAPAKASSGSSDDGFVTVTPKKTGKSK